MNHPDRLLEVLDPPPGGWLRLVRRRSEEPSWLIPLAALTCAITLAVFVFPAPQGPPLKMQLNGARLLDEHSQGTTVRMLDSRRTVALPSSDPNVRLYWIEPGSNVQRSNDGTSDGNR